MQKILLALMMLLVVGCASNQVASSGGGGNSSLPEVAPYDDATVEPLPDMVPADS